MDRILIVDDEIVNLQVLKNFLFLEGYEIVSATSGYEALDILSKENFILILLDIMMPGMSGFTVCETIRKSYSKLELPVIMLTAKNQPKDIVTGFECGANDYITKPFSKEELLSRVKNIISMKKAKEEAIINLMKYERETQKRLIAEKLNEMTSFLNRQVKLDNVLEQLSNTINTFLPFDKISIFLKCGQNFKLVFNNKCRDLENIFFSDEDYYFFKEIQNNKNKKWSITNLNKELWFEIPIIYNNNIYGNILLESSKEIDYNEEDIKMVSSFINQSLVIIENIRLFEEIEDKNKILEENFSKLKFFENINMAVYTEKNKEKMVDYLLVILNIGLDFKYREIIYFEYKPGENVLKMENYLNFDNLNYTSKDFLNLSYEETLNKINNILIKNISFLNMKCNIKLSESMKHKIINNNFVILENSEIFIEKSLSKKYIIFKLSYSDKLYGVVVLGFDFKEPKINDIEIINIFTNSLSIFLEKERLEKEQLNYEKEYAFRCRKCNRKLLVYKGKTDFIEIKCPWCNAINTKKD